MRCAGSYSAQGGCGCFRSNQRATDPSIVPSAGATALGPDHFPKATIELRTLRLVSKRQKVRHRLAAVEAEDGTANRARLRPLSVAVAVSLECLLSVALETCASRAALTPEQLHVHLVAYGAFLWRGERVNLRREVLTEETNSLGLAVHRGVCCTRIRKMSANLEMARSRVPSPAAKCAREGSPRGYVGGVTGTAAPETSLSVKA